MLWFFLCRDWYNEQGRRQSDIASQLYHTPVTRGKTVRPEDLHGLIRSLEIPEAEKQRLLAMTPASYVGMAAELARRV